MYCTHGRCASTLTWLLKGKALFQFWARNVKQEHEIRRDFDDALMNMSYNHTLLLVWNFNCKMPFSNIESFNRLYHIIGGSYPIQVQEDSE